MFFKRTHNFILALTAAAVLAGVRFQAAAEVADAVPLADVGPLAAPAQTSTVLATQINTLLSMNSRPTVEEFENTLSPRPALNPFRVQDSWNLFVSREIPTIIARLERAFPGATYAFLGRDSVFLADIIDAFYRAIGQAGRVVRLNASGNSLGGASKAVILKFLENNGLRNETIELGPAYVLVDATNWATNSQSRQYVRPFYEQFAATGRPLSILIRKFNVLDTKLRNQSILTPDFNVDEFLNYQEKNVTTEGPGDIMNVVAGDFAYTKEWHGKFGRLTEALDGRVSAAPGPAGALRDKEAILADLYEVTTTVSTIDFYSLVEQAAAKFNYSFPKTRVLPGETLKPVAQSDLIGFQIKNIRTQLNNLIDCLPADYQRGSPFTTNGQLVFVNIKRDVFSNDKPGSANLALVYIVGIARAHDLNRISDLDLKRLIKRVLANYPPLKLDADFADFKSSLSESNKIEIETFRSGLKSLYENNKTFRKVWDDERRYFLDESHISGISGSRVYKRMVSFLNRTCGSFFRSNI